MRVEGVGKGGALALQVGQCLAQGANPLRELCLGSRIGMRSEGEQNAGALLVDGLQTASQVRSVRSQLLREGTRVQEPLGLLSEGSFR
jgi:hypothetical protein